MEWALIITLCTAMQTPQEDCKKQLVEVAATYPACVQALNTLTRETPATMAGITCERARIGTTGKDGGSVLQAKTAKPYGSPAVETGSYKNA